MLSPDTILQNRYRILRQLGQGGMGTVYEAIDERLDTTVALKETHFTEERMAKQFEREARLLARLHHAALPRVIDHFTENEGQFLVMNFISGEDLWELLEKSKEPFPVDEVLKWGDQLLDALDYLHTQDPPIIHRDIKPQNLKLTSRGQIILLDFGLAKGFAGQISRVTTSGSIFGYTPNYAPLEQIHGTGTDARSDIYSLAATLYHLLTGKVPSDALSRAMALTSDKPDPLQPANEINRIIPASVAEVIQRAMATNPAKRPASAAEMRRMLQAVGKANEPSLGYERRDEILPETVYDLPQGAQELKATIASPIMPTADSADSISRKGEAEEAVIRAARQPEHKPTIASPPRQVSSPARKPQQASTPSFGFYTDSDNSKKKSSLRWIVGGLAALLIFGLVIPYLLKADVSLSDARIRIVYTDQRKKDAETAEARLRNMGAAYVDLNRVAGDYGNNGQILYTGADSERANYLADKLSDIEKLSTDPAPADSTPYFKPNQRGEFTIFLTK